MAIRMGYWDCPGCGRKRIQGPERSCAECGRPRDQDVKFYTDDSAPVVDDKGELAKAKAGADWHCPYCGADNPKGALACVGCGATSDGAKAREERMIPTGAAGAPGSVTPASTGVASPAPSPAGGAVKYAQPVKKSSSGKVGTILAVIAALVVGVYFLFVRTTPLSVTVQGKTWTKELLIERLETKREDAWLKDVPAGAREISRYRSTRTERVQVGTKRVKTGTKDLGNGYFEDVYEDRPEYGDRTVEDIKVVYEVDRWVRSKTLKNEKADGTEPDYPTFQGTSRERIAGRENKISLSLSGEDQKQYAYTLDLEGKSELRKKADEYAVGKRYTAMVNAIGAVLELQPK